MSFKLISQSKISQARRGRLKTAHGEIQTPFFMPIATRGAVKGITAEEVKNLSAQIILANTYHLMVSPGKEFLEKMGGLHNFMGWNGPILTDSGGYQVFSLSRHRKISDEGVKFKNPLNGSVEFLTPEESIKIQRAIGSDITITLDECTPYSPKKAHVEEAVGRTIKWARRCFEEHKRKEGKRGAQKNNKQLLFAVVQGDRFLDLRLHCLSELAKMDFDGFCYGGMAPLKTVYTMLDKVIPHYPADKPRYLMGVGYPDNIVEAVRRGIDMFDCVIPTREGRHGRIFVRDKKVKLGEPGFFKILSFPKREFLLDKKPISPICSCTACQNHTRSYINYLFKIGDYLGPRLASLHNVCFYLDLMREIRENIEKGKL